MSRDCESPGRVSREASPFGGSVGRMVVAAGQQPRVVMMCGPGGAGKTTYAKRLERDGWVRLSFEVEFWERGITTMPSPEVVADVATELKSRLLSEIAAGRDVVLDFGFWFRRQRDEYRALLAPHGIVPEVVYIATSLDTILSRIGNRLGRAADDWPLTGQEATEYFARFEPPTPGEGPLEIVGESSGAGRSARRWYRPRDGATLET